MILLDVEIIKDVTYDVYLKERDKIIQNFQLMMSGAVFREYLFIAYFTDTLVLSSLDAETPPTVENVYYDNFAALAGTAGKNIVYSPDTIVIVLFHRLGANWVCSKAIANVLKNMGFEETVFEGNDVHIKENYKVSGFSIVNSDILCAEFGHLTFSWTSDKYDLLTVEERTRPITGIEDEAALLSIPMDRDTFQTAFIAEVEKLLETLDPISTKIIKDESNELLR